MGKPSDYVLRPSETVIEIWGDAVIEALDWPPQYHEVLAGLEAPVRQVIATEILLWQVNNGGFWQYFYNSYGIGIDDAIAGLRAIGEEKYADVAVRAKQLFGVFFPEDRTLRMALIGDDQSNPRIDFRPLESEFYDLDPSMTGFAYDKLDEYAQANIDLNGGS